MGLGGLLPQSLLRNASSLEEGAFLFCDVFCWFAYCVGFLVFYIAMRKMKMFKKFCALRCGQLQKKKKFYTLRCTKLYKKF